MTYGNSKTLKEEIILAKSTKDIKVQTEISNSCMISLRKALATNPYLEVSIANALLFDPCANVSFQASKNSNCAKQRDFSKDLIDNKCVTCDLDILDENCNNCL